MNASINHALRLITLWIAWLLAMLFHVDLGLMPLFHGQSPEIHSQVQEGALPLLFGAMLGYFLLPLIAIVLIAYAATAVGLSLPRFQGQCLESCFYTDPMKTNDHNECPVYATPLQR